jgi:hypothetical protein
MGSTWRLLVPQVTAYSSGRRHSVINLIIDYGNFPPMDNDYIYRLDGTFKLQSFPDGCHRAPRWPQGSNPFPHKLLKSRLSLLASTQGIYRICFFVNLADAQAARLTYINKGATTTLARCRKVDVLLAGFTDSWDDGFKPGIAHLFWIEEDLTAHNGTLSAASIPFDRFEALVNGVWVPLATHLAPATPPSLPASPVTAPAKRSFVSRILSALRFKQST